MSTVAFVSMKGAPGVSTVAYECVSRWPRPVVGMELDVSGGSWALRHELEHATGLVSLAATRAELDWELISEHGHRTGNHGLLVCAPPGRDSATALSVLEPRLRTFPQTLDLILDMGRMHDSLLNLCRTAEQVVVVARPNLEDIAVLKRECDTLAHMGCTMKLVLIGTHPYGSNEIVGVPILGVVPFDPLRGFASKRKTKLFARAYDRIVADLAERVNLHPIEVAT
jgi:hypothetical protein